MKFGKGGVYIDNVSMMLAGISERMTQLLALNADIAFDMQLETRKRFDASQDLNGVPWAKLKYPRYRANGTIKNKAETAKPLIDHKHLYRSMNAKAGNGFAMVGTNVEYAKMHDEGYTGMATFKVPRGKGKNRRMVEITRKVNVPQRQFSGLTTAQIEKYKNMINTFLLTGGR